MPKVKNNLCLVEICACFVLFCRPLPLDYTRHRKRARCTPSLCTHLQSIYQALALPVQFNASDIRFLPEIDPETATTVGIFFSGVCCGLILPPTRTKKRPCRIVSKLLGRLQFLVVSGRLCDSCVSSISQSPAPKPAEKMPLLFGTGGPRRSRRFSEQVPGHWSLVTACL